MTKAMRWGASALLILGGVAVGSFVGCSSDDEVTPTPTEDTGGEDTATPPVDTGMVDTGTATDSGAGETATDAGDGGTTPSDRAVTLLFGSPDLGGRFACFGAFGSSAVETTDPVQALGPIGIPTASGKPEDYQPIPYGAVIPLPLDKVAQAALQSLTTVIYLTDTNPLKASPPTDCKSLWKTVRADTKAWQKFAPATIVKGDHALVSIIGCKNPASGTTGECGAAAGPAALEFRVDKLATTKPTTFAGASTGPKVGIQFVHYSPFAGVTGAVPSFQNIDVYLQLRKPAGGGGSDAGTDGGDAAVDADLDAATDAAGDGGVTFVPDGAPVKLADNVKYKDLAAASVGVQVGDFGDAAVLLISPHGVAPCAPGSTGCATIALPMKPFLDAYKPAGGGFFDGQNQFLGILGSPVPKTVGDPTTATIRLPMGNADSP